MTVQLSEVQGIPGLNGKEFKIRTLGPFIFSIGDISGIDGEYIKVCERRKNRFAINVCLRRAVCSRRSRRTRRFHSSLLALSFLVL
jgi:hypothetical protein